MKKEIYMNSTGWKIVATERGVSTFERKSNLNKFFAMLPVWLPTLVFLPVIWKDHSVFWPFASVMILLGSPLAWVCLNLPFLSVTRNLCVLGTGARWKTSDSSLVSIKGLPDYIYIFDQKKGKAFPAWRSSDKNDLDLAENYLSRFIPRKISAEIQIDPPFPNRRINPDSET